MSHAIEVDELSKRFTSRRRAPGLKAAFSQLFSTEQSEHVAVDRVSFRISRGERVAFVGPNGAGKSTTIKMLTGILHPTSGRASVLGLVPWRDRQRLAYDIGTVFGQQSQLWYHLPAADTFELLGASTIASARSTAAAFGRCRTCSSSAASSPSPCASCPSGSACAARSWPACCTIRASCSSTSPPSGWT